MRCKLCRADARPFAEGRLLDRFDVAYFLCENCHFVFTEEPYWLDTAYSDAVSQFDLGVVSRALDYSRLVQPILLGAFDPNARFIDYGAGYGLFVRLMRNLGFDFYHYDKFCSNLLARWFDADREGRGQYEVLTAFEVFEHLVNPLEEIERMLTFSNSLLFSTLLLPASNPRPGEWWYYAPQTGQHISFYGRESLARIALHFGLRLYSNGASMHLLTRKKIPELWMKVSWKSRSAGLAARLLRKRLKHPSLLEADFVRVNGASFEG